jgi:uncharacterized protein (UPF0332 family)
MPDESSAEESPWGRTLEHAFEIWINPEVERRRGHGRLPAGFVVLAAQVVMNVGKAPVVRLNEEVRLVVKVPSPEEPFKVGDAVPINWDEVAEVHLGPDDENAGHMTLIRDRNRWLLSFDFRYNAERANDCLDAAREFLGAARDSLQANRLRVFAETLFGATELAVKAKLLTMPDPEILKTKKHGMVAGKYNRWANLGNADVENAKLLNRLSNMRSLARYVGGPFSLTSGEAANMLAQAEKLLDEAEARVPARRRWPSQSSPE